MPRTPIATFLLLASALLTCADAGEISPETRKREFESIQKELEASRPDDAATREQVMAFLELMMEKYGTFARSNPKTAEGFEAAFTVAATLQQLHHQKTSKFLRLAAESAPPAGVDVKHVAQCWASMAAIRFSEGDPEGAQELLNKVKAIDPETFKQLSAQFKDAEGQKEEYVQKVEKAVGKAPQPVEGLNTSGKKVSIADYKGKVVVIDFWASWCGPCMMEMPNVVELYKEFHPKGLEVLGVSWDKEEAGRDAAIKKHGMSWPVITDTDHSISEKWDIQAIPCTILIDKKGIVRKVYLRGEALADCVAKLLDE